MNTFINQKAQELCFALLRVSAHIRRTEMRQSIERLCYELIENLSYKNPEMALSAIDALRNFVVLGKNIFQIEPLNAKVLERELERLANEVKISAGMAELPDLESLFTKRVEVRQSVPQKVYKQEKVAIRKERPVKSEIPEEVVIKDAEVGNPEVEYGNDAEDGNSAIRKEKIYIMLRTAPEGRLALKEIVSAFPEVSDRTVRYDLKRLAEEGRIIRQGSGGPSNYYKVRSDEPISEDAGGVINLPAATL